MTVIAMTREMGTLGKDVALGLAEELDLKIVHHELVEHDLAEKLRLSESTVHRFLEARPSLRERWRFDRNGLSTYTAEEILEIAAAGKVLIRGWGATYLLRPVSHVLCVRICAPLQFRVKVLMERMGIDDERLVRKEIEQNDAAHSRTMLRLFRADWQNPLHYDVVLNTERVPVSECVRQIVTLTRSSAFRETEASRAALTHRTLEARVNAALHRRFGRPTRNLIVDVAVDGGTGKLSLRGAAADRATVREVVEAIESVPGLPELENELVVMRPRFTD